MNWEEAKQRTIAEWRRIRSTIGRDDETRLLADINAECDLCRKASDVAEDPSERCESCLGFQQFGGCHEANLAMSELVMGKDLERLTVLVDDFIEKLESIETSRSSP